MILSMMLPYDDHSGRCGTAQPGLRVLQRCNAVYMFATVAVGTLPEHGRRRQGFVVRVARPSLPGDTASVAPEDMGVAARTELEKAT